MFFQQIEKFQCLKSSTAQGLQHGTLRRHVARVTCPQTCLEVSQLLVQKVQKPHMFDLETHSHLQYDALWSFCSIGGLWALLQNCFAVLHPCVLIKYTEVELSGQQLDKTLPNLDKYKGQILNIYTIIMEFISNIITNPAQFG